MTKTSKVALCALMAGAVALTSVPQSAQAAPITGTISFAGGVVAYSNNNGTGNQNADLTTDHSLVFSGDYVSTPPLPSGSFTGIPQGTQVIIAPLAINPIGSPAVPSGPLWSITGYGFTFTVVTLIQQYTSSSLIQLVGTGYLNDGNPADQTLGTWNASVGSTAAGTNVTFSFQSTSGAISAPDSGASMLLLGMGVAGLAAFGALRKQVA